MIKELSIVRVDNRKYRTIARDNWGLTDQQMMGKHVHHRIKRCDGGTDDPTNLYVCSDWFHANVWHAEDGFNSLVLHATRGGEITYQQKKGIHGLTPEQKSQYGKMGAAAEGWKKSKERLSGIFGDRTSWEDVYVENGRKTLSKLLAKNPDHQSEAGRKGALVSMERGVGVNTPEARKKGGTIAGRKAVESGQLAKARTRESILKGAKAGANTMFMDPNHPELGIHNAGVLSRLQRKHGFPSGKETRTKVG